MNHEYLIPANTKRGKLILGWFRPFDLLLFSCGLLVSFILLAFMPIGSTMVTILVLSPALITGFLVLPVPNYHNMLTVIIEIYNFLTKPQTYRWKGWCYKDGNTKPKK